MKRLRPNKIADHLRQQASSQDMLACEAMLQAADEIELWEDRTIQGAEIIMENVSIITNLRKLVKDLADDLEVEVENHYKDTKDYPSEMRRYERDMSLVYEARKVLKED
jgi:hypothetical protein